MYQARDDDPELVRDERWQLAQRVAHSETFRRAARLRTFLLFVVEKTVRNQPSDLNEYTIGTMVFERPETFNPADDSLVRTSARQLRTKLHEYFETEGRSETRILEIPKGSYLLQSLDRPDSVEPASPEAPVPAAGPRPGRRLIPLLIGVAALSLLTAAAGWLRHPAAETSLHPAANLLTTVFPQRGLELNLVLADSALVLVNAFRQETMSLDQYIRREEQRPLPLPAAVPGGATPSTFPGGRLITSYRDTIFASQLAELGAGRGWKVTVRHSRLLQVRDFRKGNFVLLGSTWSNPWVQLFEDKCNFRFTRDRSTGQFGIENTAPLAGEKRFYTSTPEQARNGVSHARIALVPNLSDGGKVLLLSGLHTESSEGATEAVLAPGFLAEAERRVPGGKLDRLKLLELLIEIRSLDGAVQECRLVAPRCLL
jgi:hypothetical protein